MVLEINREYPKAGEIWQHFKDDQKQYIILGINTPRLIPPKGCYPDYIARHTETDRPLFLYETPSGIFIATSYSYLPEYENFVFYYKDGAVKLYARPLLNFMQTLGDGKPYHRFTRLVRDE